MDRLVLRGQTTAVLRLESTTCISQRVRTNLVARGLQVPTSRVIYQGIPVERFPCKAEPGAIGAPARVLFAGQLVPDKGADTLIRAAHLLAERRGADALEVTTPGAGRVTIPVTCGRSPEPGPRG